MFIRKDFILYDSCIQTVLGPQLLFVYEWLRRFVRRSEDEVPQVRKLRAGNKVVARVGQTKLAQLAGYAHRQNITKALHMLGKLGWIQVVPSDTNSVCCYILGEYVKDGAGGKHEVYYADALVQELIDWLLGQHRAEFPSQYKKNEEGGEDDAPGYQYGKLSDAPVGWRIQRVSEWLNRRSGCSPVTAPPVTGDPQYLAEHLSGCSPTTSGMQSYDFRGVQSYDCTEEENSEVENLEVDKGWGEGPVASLPSPPLSGAEDNSPERSFAGKSKVPRDVDEEPTLSESGEYASVPPPPPAPIPKWMQESPGVAVGDNRACGPVPKVMSRVHADAQVSQVSLRPRVPERLAGIVEEASARGRKAAEAQLQKAKAHEAKVASLGGKPIPVTRKRQLTSLENQWKELMEARFSGTQIAAWEGKERGQVWNLVEKYTGEIVGEALHYLVERWDEIRTRMLKGRGGVPSVGFLLRFHDVLVVESQRWTEYRHVKKQVDEWYGGDPYKPNPPQELHQRYLALRKEMADLGLPV